MKTKILGKIPLSLGALLALLSVQAQVPANKESRPSTNPKYRLIDLGTLGGPDSSNVYPARNLNNRGQMIAFSATNVPEPECFQGDCYVNHAILRQRNGTIIELPAPSGIDATMNNSLASVITQNGLIGGFFENGLIDPLTDFPELRAVVWNHSHTATNLGTFGGNSSQVDNMNRCGRAVGVALNTISENPDFASFMNFFIPAATQARAFIWKDGLLRDLGTLGGNDACAADINDAGEVFGMSYVDSTANDTTGLPTTHPFLWVNGHMQDVGSLGGTLSVAGSFANGPFGPLLNKRGQAIGTSTLPGDGTWHAFLWDGTMMKDLGTAGGNFSEPLAIDDSGQVVGRADFSPDSKYHHAALWRNGVLTDLGVVDPCQNATATSINARGEIVGGLGACTDDSNDIDYFSAFYWKNGVMVDVNTLISNPSDLHLDITSSINDRGEIVGNGLLPSGEVHAVLLVPLSQE